jgi:NitT/TauT family transport system ATP-binding protein
VSGPGFITVDDLHVDYGTGQRAIAGLSMAVGEGEFVAVVGPSGCGKSTLLHVLSGLLTPSSGDVRIKGQPVEAGLAQMPRVGYVFQDHRLLPWRSVAQNLEIVLAAATIPKEEWPTRIDRYLRMLEIERFRDAWPLRLSGGQRQRVSIARALVIDPVVVLMDEPFSTLDEVTARTMRQELLQVWEESRKTVVFVTHSIREALFLADRVIVLSRGPARLLEEMHVPVARPRAYEDPHLTELEARIVERVMGAWGLEDAGPRPVAEDRGA